MANYIEINPQEILANPDMIVWVERQGDKVNYFGNGQTFTITYADAAAAQQAIDDFRDAANEDHANDLVSGDIVEIRRASDKTGTGINAGVIYLKAPTLDSPYWLFQAQDLSHFIYIAEELTVVKRP